MLLTSSVLYNLLIFLVSASLDIEGVEKEDYQELMNTTEVADISIFAVYFWNMFIEVIRRDLDVIHYSSSKIPERV